jgi:Glycosyltransferase family 87
VASEPRAKRYLSPRVVAAVLAALLVSYLILWLGFDNEHRTVNDFMATYVGSWLVRTGHRTQLYDYATQFHGYQLFVHPGSPSPSVEPPFVGVPAAAVVAVPLTFLGAATAYGVWSAFQLCLLIGAVAIAWRAAPHPRRQVGVEALAIVLIPLASFATLDLLRSGQWDGLSALGIALAYRCWRRDRYASGSACLVATALLAKPQLVLGLLAFLVGWRDRRVLAGALAAGLVLGLASLAVVGAAGATAWWHLVGADAHLYSATGLYGFIALPSAWFGAGPLVTPVTYAGIAVLVGLCLILGNRLRSGRLSLGPAFAAAACLSLLAAPHSYAYDAVMLVPALVWVFAEYSPFSPTRLIRNRSRIMVFLWYASTITAFSDRLAPDVLVRAGSTSVWILICLAVCLWKTAHGSARPRVAPGRIAGSPLEPPQLVPS